MVREKFKALWDEVRGPDAVSSATWTGRPSLREHAAVIQALAPVALESVQRLIDDEELVRDNGGPVDADRAVALQQLRALHHALGDLIAAVDQGRSLEPMFERLRLVRQEAKVAMGKATAALPVTTSALIALGSVVGIVEFFVGNVVVAFAVGGIAGNTLKDALRSPHRLRRHHDRPVYLASGVHVTLVSFSTVFVSSSAMAKVPAVFPTENE